MNRLRLELLPAIARGLLDLGVASAAGGAHGLRRIAERLIWDDPLPPDGRLHGRPHGHYMEVHHHYRCHCEPRCCERCR